MPRLVITLTETQVAALDEVYAAHVESHESMPQMCADQFANTILRGALLVSPDPAVRANIPTLTASLEED